jgi:CubicO group peptidase (beta-lactamase class C family)
MQRFVSDGEVDGAALAVAIGPDVVAERYVGMAAPSLRSGPDVLWPLASISKLYSAAVVLALVEQGELTLSTLVRDVLPEFDGDGREQVTLRHLLTHTSGVIYESPEMEAVLLRQLTLDEIVDEAYSYPLQFVPGSRFSYSDYGIALAARVASTVAGVEFPELVRALVLEPGDLRLTFLPPPPEEYDRVARIVGALASGTQSAQYNSAYARALGHPAFGAVASVTDLLRLGLLFAPGGDRRILSEATIRAMTTDQTGGAVIGSLIGLSPDAPRPWGLGFGVRGNTVTFGFGDITSPQSFGHPGATGCTVLVDPVANVSLAFVSNRHLRADPVRATFRLDAIINGVLAAVT